MTEQLTLTVDELAIARQWKAENPDAYRLIVGWAQIDHDMGRSCSMQLYIELLRRPELRPAGFERSDAVYLVNHNLRRDLSLLIQEERPHLVFRNRHGTSDGPGVPNATRERRSRGNGSDAQGPSARGGSRS